VSLAINSSDVLVDHTWIWRADHGTGVGWENNTAANGMIVAGDDVTAYGLFVEHYQEFQVLWKGNGGRTYFYQSEIPYDLPRKPNSPARRITVALGNLGSIDNVINNTGGATQMKPRVTPQVTSYP
jgi:hypothetical protein